LRNIADSGWAIKEWGFGAKVALNAVAMQFSLSAMFLKGSRRNLADSSQNFQLFPGRTRTRLPAGGPIGLYDIRALVADNMAPNLDSTFPTGREWRC